MWPELRRRDWRHGPLVAWLAILGAITCGAIAWRGVVLDSGLFRLAGIDFGVYRTQAQVLLSAGGGHIYDVALNTRLMQSLTAFSTVPTAPIPPGPPAAYPPLFVWLVTPLVRLSPAAGLAAWTALNFAGALWLAWRCAQFFPPKQRLLAGGLVLSSFPVFFALLVGQPVIFLAGAVAEAFLCFRAGRDARGGLWIAALLLKPQYGVLIAVVLILKRRWGAVLGAAAGSAVVVIGSLVVGGPASVLSYPSALSEMAGFKGTGTLAIPTDMVNWRGLVLRLAPNIDDRTGIAVTLVLGALTVGVALWAWRGPWQPHAEDFAAKWLVLLAATLLATYQSHPHGLVLMLAPLCAFLASRPAGKLVRAAVRLAIVLPPPAFALTFSGELVSWPLTMGLLVLLGAGCATAVRGSLAAVAHEDRGHGVAIGLAPA